MNALDKEYQTTGYPTTERIFALKGYLDNCSKKVTIEGIDPPSFGKPLVRLSYGRGPDKTPVYAAFELYAPNKSKLEVLEGLVRPIKSPTGGYCNLTDYTGGYFFGQNIE